MTSGRRTKARRRAARREQVDPKLAQLAGSPVPKQQLGRRIDITHGVCKKCGRTGYLDFTGKCAERPAAVNMDRHMAGQRPLRSRVKQCKEIAERRKQRA